MPRELPGMYWDNEKQRYFPLASRKDRKSVGTCSLQQVQLDLDRQSVTAAPGSFPIARRRRQSPYRALSDLPTVLRTAHRDSLIHQIQSSQISLTSEVTRSTTPFEGLYSAFRTVSHNGCEWSFAGDTHGWFYSSVVDQDHEDISIVNRWQPQFHLSSEVSSIGVSSTTCVATSFGPECRVLYVPLDPSVEGTYTTRIDSRIVHDVWTADLQGSRLVLGANKQAVVIDDIATCASIQRLPTQSDVLALAQHENILYTGLRNGGIFRSDARLQKLRIHPLFDSISQRTSSITGLKLLCDYQLLVSFIDGEISTFDLRFPVRTPLMTFTGNCNSYTIRLPLAVDPCEKFLFAAGQDNRIRIWSLLTGGPALEPGKTGSTDQTLFQRPFEHHIAALQVVEERKGVCLWAASGTELSKYSLGHLEIGTRVDITEGSTCLRL